jgi:succinoglycan biosynthesis protein ExoV
MNYLVWPGNNFGDKLNDIIFPHVGIKNRIEFKKLNLQCLPPKTYLGLGTLLNKKIHSKVTVFGTGADGNRKPSVELDYKFVRGKLTANFLNLKEDLGKGDTAYFLKDYIQNKASTIKTENVGIIPHYVNNNLLHDKNIISPLLPVDEFIYKVSQCKIILAEAMHGAICADMLRIPWSPISLDKTTYPVQHFKWNDWVSVFELNIQFGTINDYRLYISNDTSFKNVAESVKETIYSNL